MNKTEQLKERLQRLRGVIHNEIDCILLDILELEPKSSREAQLENQIKAIIEVLDSHSAAIPFNEEEQGGFFRASSEEERKKRKGCIQSENPPLSFTVRVGPGVPPEMDDLLDQNFFNWIDEVKLSHQFRAKIHRVLVQLFPKNLGLLPVRKIIEVSDTDLMATFECGEKTVQTLKDILAKRGLKLKGEECNSLGQPAPDVQQFVDRKLQEVIEDSPQYQKMKFEAIENGRKKSGQLHRLCASMRDDGKSAQYTQGITHLLAENFFDWMHGDIEQAFAKDLIQQARGLCPDDEPAENTYFNALEAFNLTINRPYGDFLKEYIHRIFRKKDPYLLSKLVDLSKDHSFVDLKS